MAGGKPAWADDARTGPVRSYLEQRIFACEGMIVVIDHRPTEDLGECVVLDCNTAVERVKALQKDYRGQTRAQQPQRMRDLWTQRLNGCQNILECVKEARQMGDPTDPQVQAFWKRHNSLRVAGYAKAGARKSRQEILNATAAPGIKNTFLDKSSKTLALPPGVSPTPKPYTPPVRRQG
jgi:hypothetical protein